MSIFVVFVLVILGIVFYNFSAPVPQPTEPIEELAANVPAITYVLSQKELLQNAFGYSFGTNANLFQPDGTLKADGIYPITIYDCGMEKEGFCIDFAGSNGYMIITPDYEVYGLNTTGNYDKLGAYDALIFSPYDGIIYTTGTSTAVLEKNFSVHAPIQSKDIYNGQIYSGDGGIETPDTYILDRYGSTYQSHQAATLPYYTFFDQYDLSIYYSNYGRTSEGNCTLTAIFSALSYLQLIGRAATLPSAVTTVPVDASQDVFYSKYAADPSYVIETPKELPQLYIALRQLAIDKYRYQVGAVSPLTIETITQTILDQYNSTLQAKNHYLWSYELNALEEINQGLPVLVNTANSRTYESHSMVITGYRTYRKILTYDKLTYYDSICLLQVNDSWSNTARYYDTAVSELIATMVTFK